MNEFKEIYDLLKTLNIPVAYDHFDSDKTTEPPFIAYREIDSDTFKADCKTYYRPYNFEIELVTVKKDVGLQKSLEELLNNHKFPFNKFPEVWDEEEKIYHNFYEI